MKFSPLLLTTAAFLSVATDTTFALGSLKGTPEAPSPRRRLDKLEGPTERECEFSEKKDEVEFECKTKKSDDRRALQENEEEPEAEEPEEEEIEEPREDEPEEEEPEDEDEEKEDEEDEEKEDEEEDIPEPSSRGITITPQEVTDKIKYKVKTVDEGIRVKLEYEQEIETDTTEQETEATFELLFESLIEYVKGPGQSETEAYDWDQDEIIQTIPLSGWDDIAAVASDADGIVSYFTASTPSLGESLGSASFNFTVSRADIDEHITANSMKIDVRILDFPWQREDSYVALLSTFESKVEVELEYDDEATVTESGKSKKAKDVMVSFGQEMDESLGFSAYGQYVWEEEAIAAAAVASDENTTLAESRQGAIDVSDPDVIMMDAASTKTIEVIATSPPSLGNETYQSIAYSFVGSGAHQASNIYWDPQTGIGYESSDAMSATSIVGVIGSVAVALVYAFL